MRIRTLCVLLLLALAALPAWSAAPSPGSVPQITLADILAPVETGELPAVFQAAACIPPCTTNAQCQTICECAAAVCSFSTFCQKRVCNCTVCP